MHAPHRALAAALAVLALAGPSAAESGRSKFDWDAFGAEFCRLTVAGDLPAMRDMLSDTLVQEIAAASANPDLPPPRVLFQSYSNEVPVCRARTRNAAIVAITRSMPGGGAPSWTEYLVVAPDPDGTMRIDDVLFATRRSDTLRSRLAGF